MVGQSELCSFRPLPVFPLVYVLTGVAFLTLLARNARIGPAEYGLTILVDQNGLRRSCQDMLAKLHTLDDASMIVAPISPDGCKAQDFAGALYERGRYLDATLLYERVLASDNSAASASDVASIFLRLSTSYEQLDLTESAEYFARQTLEHGGPIGPVLDVARRFAEARDLSKAAGYLRMACTAYTAARPIPMESVAALQVGDKSILWAQTFSPGYLEEVDALDTIVNDANVSEETRAQVHWEMVGGTRPLLSCGEELFRRQGPYGDGHEYYYATPSLVPHPDRPGEDHLILSRLLNYRIDPAGRYYKDYLPANDTSGVLRSACVLFTGRGAQAGTMVRVLDGRFERAPYRFLGTEDTRLFRLETGELRVFWTSWEFSKYLGEGSRIVSGILDVDSSTVRVDRLFQSPHDRFLEKNWVVFQVPGGPLRVVYEWYPLHVGTFNRTTEVGKLHLDHTAEMPLAFKHIRGSSNGCYHNNKLWFLVHGTTWHKGPGPVYYHRMAVLNPVTLKLERYTHPFKLESEAAPVEFSLGISIDDQDRLSIAYSVFDGSSVVRRVPMWKVEALMVKKN